MKTVTIAGHKGGLGKTTLCVALAEHFVRADSDVAVVDLDPQKSLTEWWDARPSELEALSLATATADQLRANLGKLEEVAEFVFIDTPPAHADTIKTAVELADIVIVPCSPSATEIRGVGETISLLEEMHKPFFFVINKYDGRTNLGQQVLPLIGQYGKLAPSTVGNRIAYAGSLLDGQSPLGMGNKEITKEISVIAEYLVKQLEKRA